MAEVGILGPADRVQLVDGVIFDMPPIGPGHSVKVGGLNILFVHRFEAVAVLRVQQPVYLGLKSEPEPDIALARLKPDIDEPYGDGHPTPEDMLLVVEVAVSSLDFDLNDKAN